MSQTMDIRDDEPRPQTRPRSRSAFSILSHKSDKSSGSKNKAELIETESDKQRNRFKINQRSNPNSAITEAQPAIRAQNEVATLQPLRSMSYTDWRTGDLITDPDASNPSRARLERPLDTIRSFEAAANYGYSKRNPPFRTESADATMGIASRRTSVIGAAELQDPSLSNPRSAQRSQGYDGSRDPRYAPASNGYDSRRSSWVRPNQDYGRAPPTAYPPRRNGAPRPASAPMQSRPVQSDYSPYYGSHNHQGSHDTMQTGESSGSQSEPWTNSTDPSSENSSIDRLHASRQNETGDAYGQQYGRRSASPFKYPLADEIWQDAQAYSGQQPSNGDGSDPSAQKNAIVNFRRAQAQMTAPPAPPAKTQPVVRVSSVQQDASSGPQRPGVGPRQVSGSKKLGKAPPNAQGEKKKSWLRRRFSKS